jgi:predicted transcriptional regulator
LKHKCRIVVVKTIYETPKSCPFDDLEISLRELSRRTGVDVSYLSKVRRGELAITEETYSTLMGKVQAALV